MKFYVSKELREVRNRIIKELEIAFIPFPIELGLIRIMSSFLTAIFTCSDCVQAAVEFERFQLGAVRTERFFNG